MSNIHANNIQSWEHIFKYEYLSDYSIDTNQKDSEILNGLIQIHKEIKSDVKEIKQLVNTINTCKQIYKLQKVSDYEEFIKEYKNEIKNVWDADLNNMSTNYQKVIENLNGLYKYNEIRIKFDEIKKTPFGELNEIIIEIETLEKLVSQILDRIIEIDYDKLKKMDRPLQIIELGKILNTFSYINQITSTLETINKKQTKSILLHLQLIVLCHYLDTNIPFLIFNDIGLYYVTKEMTIVYIIHPLESNEEQTFAEYYTFELNLNTTGNSDVYTILKQKLMTLLDAKSISKQIKDELTKKDVQQKKRDQKQKEQEEKRKQQKQQQKQAQKQTTKYVAKKVGGGISVNPANVIHMLTQMLDDKFKGYLGNTDGKDYTEYSTERFPSVPSNTYQLIQLAIKFWILGEDKYKEYKSELTETLFILNKNKYDKLERISDNEFNKIMVLENSTDEKYAQLYATVKEKYLNSLNITQIHSITPSKEEKENPIEIPEIKNDNMDNFLESLLNYIDVTDKIRIEQKINLNVLRYMICYYIFSYLKDEITINSPDFCMDKLQELYNKFKQFKVNSNTVEALGQGLVNSIDYYETILPSGDTMQLIFVCILCLINDASENAFMNPIHLDVDDFFINNPRYYFLATLPQIDFKIILDEIRKYNGFFDCYPEYFDRRNHNFKSHIAMLHEFFGDKNFILRQIYTAKNDINSQIDYKLEDGTPINKDYFCITPEYRCDRGTNIYVCINTNGQKIEILIERNNAYDNKYYNTRTIVSTKSPTLIFLTTNANSNNSTLWIKNIERHTFFIYRESQVKKDMGLFGSEQINFESHSTGYVGLISYGLDSMNTQSYSSYLFSYIDIFNGVPSDEINNRFTIDVFKTVLHAMNKYLHNDNIAKESIYLNTERPNSGEKKSVISDYIINTYELEKQHVQQIFDIKKFTNNIEDLDPLAITSILMILEYYDYRAQEDRIPILKYEELTNIIRDKIQNKLKFSNNLTNSNMYEEPENLFPIYILNNYIARRESDQLLSRQLYTKFETLNLDQDISKIYFTCMYYILSKLQVDLFHLTLLHIKNIKQKISTDIEYLTSEYFNTFIKLDMKNGNYEGYIHDKKIIIQDHKNKEMLKYYLFFIEDGVIKGKSRVYDEIEFKNGKYFSKSHTLRLEYVNSPILNITNTNVFIWESKSDVIYEYVDIVNNSTGEPLKIKKNNDKYYIGDYEIVKDINDNMLSSWIVGSICLQKYNDYKLLVLPYKVQEGSTYFKHEIKNLNDRVKGYYFVNVHYTKLYLTFNDDQQEFNHYFVNCIRKGRMTNVRLLFNQFLQYNYETSDLSIQFNSPYNAYFDYRMEKSLNDKPTIIPNIYPTLYNIRYFDKKEFTPIDSDNVYVTWEQEDNVCSLIKNLNSEIQKYILQVLTIIPNKKTIQPHVDTKLAKPYLKGLKKIIIPNKCNSKTNDFIKELKVLTKIVKLLGSKINKFNIYSQLISSNTYHNLNDIILNNEHTMYVNLQIRVLEKLITNVKIYCEKKCSCEDILDIFKDYLNNNIYCGIRNNNLKIFEIMFGSFLREDQVNTYKTIANEQGNECNIHQLLMGRGKSTVIVPLQAIFNPADIKLVVVPQHLENQTKNTLMEYSPLFEDFYLTHLQVTREKDTQPDDRGCIIVVSDVSLKTLYLNSIESKEKSFLKTIINDSYYIFDEIDLMINPYTSNLNFPIESDSSVYNNNNVKLFIAETLYQMFKNKLQLQEIMKLNPYNFADWYDIVLNKIGLEDRKVQEQNLNNVYDIYNTFIHIQYALSMIHNKDYGLGDVDENLEHNHYIAIPYNAVNSPSNGSEFNNILLTLILTQFSYYNSGMRTEDLVKFSEYINKQYVLVNRDFILLKGLFPSITDDNILRQLLNKEIIDLTPDENLYFDIIKIYLTEYIEPTFIRYYPKFLNASLLDIISPNVTGNKTGFSGTVNIELPIKVDDSQYAFKDIKTDDYSNGSIMCAMIGYLQNSPAKIKPYEELEYSDDKLIDYIIENNYNVLIDVGAYFMKHDINHIIKRFENSVYKDRHMLYITKDDIVMHYHIGYTEKYDNTLFTSDEIFIFYDHKHIVGMDIRQPLTLKGLTTIDSFNRFTDTSQGIFRMRNLNRGHTVDYITRNIKVNTSEKLFEHLLIKEDEYRTEYKIKFIIQDIRRILRDAGKLGYRIEHANVKINNLDELNIDMAQQIERDNLCTELKQLNLEYNELIRNYCSYTFKLSVNLQTQQMIQQKIQQNILSLKPEFTNRNTIYFERKYNIIDDYKDLKSPEIVLGSIKKIKDIKDLSKRISEIKEVPPMLIDQFNKLKIAIEEPSNFDTPEKINNLKKEYISFRKMYNNYSKYPIIFNFKYLLNNLKIQISPFFYMNFIRQYNAKNIEHINENIKSMTTDIKYIIYNDNTNFVIERNELFPFLKYNKDKKYEVYTMFGQKIHPINNEYTINKNILNLLRIISLYPISISDHIRLALYNYNNSVNLIDSYSKYIYSKELINNTLYKKSNELKYIKDLYKIENKECKQLFGISCNDKNNKLIIDYIIKDLCNVTCKFNGENKCSLFQIYNRQVINIIDKITPDLLKEYKKYYIDMVTGELSEFNQEFDPEKDIGIEL